MTRAVTLSAGALRREVSARNRELASEFSHEKSYGASATVIYAEAEDGSHGNFLPAVYRRIAADPEWSRRLQKTYTGSAWIARSEDRQRRELECCTSSDALLMNVFCHPRVLHRREVCSLLGISAGARAEFGVRSLLPMRGGEIDRTELDLRLGALMVESKLTEGGFGTASRDRVSRYLHVDSVFDPDALSWGPRGLAGYQLVRGALAAFQSDGRYMLLWDQRRADLREQWFAVLKAIRSSEVRSRMVLLSWQELAACLPGTLQHFLSSRYGIVATGSTHPQ